MYKLYKKPIVKAYPDIKLREPRISKFVLFLLKISTRLYLFIFYGIARIVIKDDMLLLDPFKRTLAGKSRCIIAFRHPNGGEPQLLTWFFLFKLWFYGKKHKVQFAHWPHALMIYGYEVVRWGGWVPRYIMPNVGAMPIHHSKMDTKGMARIYEAMTTGRYPVALAPEGQVSYTADDVPRLEPGIIRIGFQVVQRLKEKNIDVPVEILPISIHFRYGSWGKIIEKIIVRRIEKFCGFKRSEAEKFPYFERLRRCRDKILEINEERYFIKKDDTLSFEQRLEKVINSALETAERFLGIKSEGDYFTRLYKVRQIYWDRIFLPGVESLDKVSRLERSVKDLMAGEAWYISRHAELADFGWYFRRPLPDAETAFHNRIEYIKNLWDFASRTMGGAQFDRIRIFPKKVFIQAGEVINLSERFSDYKADRKATITSCLDKLKDNFYVCIDRMNKSNPE